MVAASDASAMPASDAVCSAPPQQDDGGGTGLLLDASALDAKADGPSNDDASAVDADGSAVGDAATLDSGDGGY